MDDLDALIAQHDLEAHRDAILRHALPAVHIETTTGEPPLGASKLGGQPDVPPGFAWPRVPATPDWPAWGSTPLAFLAQFRLADVAAHNAEDALPHTGMLYLFYEANEQPWGSRPVDRGGWRVLYAENAGNATPAPSPDDLTERFPARAVRFIPTPTLLPWEYDEFVRAFGDMSGAEIARYHPLRVDLDSRHGPMHQLLGYPHVLQTDMRGECQLAAHGLNAGTPEDYRTPEAIALRPGAANWRLLVQLDSDDRLGMVWGDYGHVYFWIEQERLARRDFSNVWLILQCP